MGECRFNRDGCYIHTKPGPPIGQERGCPPALCSHAAVAQERQVEKLTANADFLRESIGECHLMISRNRSEYQLKSEWENTSLPYRLRELMLRLASLEGEKAQWPKNEFGSYLTIGEYEALKDRFTQAEAREAAIQALLEEAVERLEDVQAVNGNLSVHALDFIERAKAALSPDAGHAPKEKP